MIYITIPECEYYDESVGEFHKFKGITLQMEHSLVSISKWESKWKKPFLKEEEKTYAETVDYVRCMTITQNVPEAAYFLLTQDDFNKIYEYIGDSMTATTITDLRPNRSKAKTITSEVIYYQMIRFNIPFECQKWHLSRLLTLINVCCIEEGPKQKMSRSEQAAYNRKLNAERKKHYGTKG